MKIRTPEDIKNETLNCSDKTGDLRLRQLLSAFKQVDDETIVAGVIHVFENSNRADKTFRDQSFAGQILKNLQPRSSLDVTFVLQRTLPHWDKSIEEFPYWLNYNYGREALMAAISGMSLNTEGTDKLNTIRWWLKM